MLSVLIPVYNFDIRQLIKDLYQQLVDAHIIFEIVCYDDGSDTAYKILNRSILSQFPHTHVTYTELPENLGRARIRNALAQASNYEFLLFMDCDSKVVSPNYIKYYIEHLQHDTLLYGGRCYAPTPPDRPELYLHWHYGTRREQMSASIRQQNPYHAFMTNNFLIPKIIFNKIKFDERLTQYGHEDTLFGWELQNRQIKIMHLDNPLEHIGLEENKIFLNKSRQGIDNLVFLSKEQPKLATRLLKTYHILQKWKLTDIIYFILNILYPFIEKQLQASKPHLRWFDLYKLYWLLKIQRR
ncbi:MAG: glycosyltransferase family 2 protein [Saprospiraceae bacterium]